MSLVIVFDGDNGVARVMRPSRNALLEDESELDQAERIAEKHLPPGTQFQIMDDSLLPADRIFRNAWKSGPGRVEVHLDTARTIQLDRFRAAREPLLAKLDVASVRAQEDGDAVKLAQVIAQKQALRDVTLTDLTKATTPEELHAIWPAVLGEQKLVAVGDPK